MAPKKTPRSEEAKAQSLLLSRLAGPAASHESGHKLPDEGGLFYSRHPPGLFKVSEVITWSDEVVVLRHFNTVKGQADPVEFATLLQARRND